MKNHECFSACHLEATSMSQWKNAHKNCNNYKITQIYKIVYKIKIKFKILKWIFIKMI